MHLLTSQFPEHLQSTATCSRRSSPQFPAHLPGLKKRCDRDLLTSQFPAHLAPPSIHACKVTSLEVCCSQLPSVFLSWGGGKSESVAYRMCAQSFGTSQWNFVFFVQFVWENQKIVRTRVS